MNMDTAIVEGLRKAKAMIEKPNAWCQNTAARDVQGKKVLATDEHACRYCVMGALMVVAEGPLGVMLSDLAEAFARPIGGAHVAIWNDDANRTQADVVRVFGEAIALASGEGKGESHG
jgi:hypothetical protein